ncbi:MAG TPA: hypothetical protein VF032_08080 [Thermoleophilaceae bacterium]
MRLRIALFCLVLAVIPPSAASAAPRTEQAAGGALVAQLRSGSKTCSDLSRTDLDHIGEYAMGRALGSTALHQTMNERMQSMLGDAGETRMHQLMGARFAGCAPAGGNGMMGGGYSMGAAAMMGGAGLSWMADGRWRHMSRADWQRAEERLAGGGGMPASHHSWSAWWIVVLAVAGVVLAAMAVALLVRRACTPPGAPG